MDEWKADAKYSWGGYPLGPVANTLQDRQFLWNDGTRSQSNWSDFNPQQLLRENLQIPANCAFRPMGCLTPPLSVCRQPTSP